MYCIYCIKIYMQMFSFSKNGNIVKREFNKNPHATNTYMYLLGNYYMSNFKLTHLGKITHLQ